jgi:hypothetical protein
LTQFHHRLDEYFLRQFLSFVEISQPAQCNRENRSLESAKQLAKRVSVSFLSG